MANDAREKFMTAFNEATVKYGLKAGDVLKKGTKTPKIHKLKIAALFTINKYIEDLNLTKKLFKLEYSLASRYIRTSESFLEKKDREFEQMINALTLSFDALCQIEGSQDCISEFVFRCVEATELEMC